jgi:hypothetical protein
MFRVFRLLPKLSHKAKSVKVDFFPGGGWMATFSMFRLLHKNFLIGQKERHVVVSGCFRLFRLLPKLSHKAKKGTWHFQAVQASVQGVQAFAQTFSQGKKEIRGGWHADLDTHRYTHCKRKPKVSPRASTLQSNSANRFESSV